MKFKQILAIGLTSILLLSGCAQNGTTKLEDNKNSKTEEKSTLSKEEIIQKIGEANKELKSAKMTLDMQQDVKNLSGDNQSLKTTSSGTVEMLLEPLKMHMSMKIIGENAQVNNSQPIETEMYLAENQLYMKNPMGGDKFQKIDLSSSGFDTKTYEDMVKNKEQMKYLENLGDKLNVEETEDSYILTYSGSGKEMEDIIKDNDAFKNDPSINSSDINIKNFDIKLVYDKSTFWLKSSDTNMSFDFKNEQINMEMNQKTSITTFDINKIEDIKIPDNIQ